MEVDLDGLEECLYLLWRHALGAERGHADACGTEGGDGLQVFHHHRATRDRHLAVIIRHLGTAGREQLVCRALRYIEEAVNLILLDGVTGHCHRRVMGHDLRVLKAVELLHQRTAGGGVVEVYDTHGHVLRQAVLHQRGKEHHRQQGEDDHAEPVNAIHIENLTFTPSDCPN